jgi:hypothetical protein
MIHMDVFIVAVLSFCAGDGWLQVCESNYTFPKNGLNANLTKNLEVIKY